MGKMTNLGWVVYGQDIDQLKLVILNNLFLSVYVLAFVSSSSYCVQTCCACDITRPMSLLVT